MNTIKELARFVVEQILLVIAVVSIGLSAPILYTVGVEYLVWQNPNNLWWAVAYFFVGPFACAFWMAILCHFHSIRQAVRENRTSTWKEDHGGFIRTNIKATTYMIGGFFGSVLAEVVFFVAGMALLPHGLQTRESAMLYFAIAPFAVFAPVVVLIIK